VANPRSPSEQRPAPARDDIMPYLRRLAKAEEERRVLESRLITIVTNTTFAQALQAMTSLNAGEEQPQFPMQAVRDFELIARQYESLAGRFQRFAPPVPTSCRRLHYDYGNALTLMPRIVRTLRNAIVQRDTGAAVMVGQLANGTVNRHFAAADSELDRVTRERGIPKPFDLGSGGGGSLFSPLGP
jgi:hypothetical protein